MNFRTETRVKSGAKPHRCDYCHGTIPTGAESVKIAGHWDGAFYTARGHLDCESMWRDVYDRFAGDDGMSFDLAEVFCDAGEWESLPDLRGHYPHVVTRLEYRRQKQDIAYADRLRGRGFAPHPEDCEELYS